MFRIFFDSIFIYLLSDILMRKNSYAFLWINLLQDIWVISYNSLPAFWCFSTISNQFSAIYISIFHKFEVQTVILRCWTGLYLNWFKSYYTKRSGIKIRVRTYGGSNNWIEKDQFLLIYLHITTETFLIRFELCIKIN